MVDIIIENGFLLTMDPQRDDVHKGSVIIENGLISKVDDSSGLEAKKVIDASGCVVMPGLINTHGHLAMTLFRGMADDLPLKTWLEENIWPAEAKLTETDIYIGCLLGCIEMIRSGTTAFNDMFFSMNQTARAVEQSGLRASLCYGMLDLGDMDKASLEFKKAVDFFEQWNQGADGRITVMYGPHAPYTCSTDFLLRIIDQSAADNAGIHIHIAETQFEVEQIMKRYGKSPVCYLDSLGLFERPVVAAHCVWLDDKDIDIMAGKQVNVSHNVVSNMKLASGISPVAAMLEKGVAVSLGTDGCASNNTLDMFEEMKTAALLQKVSMLDPTVLPAREVLKMATVNGARALGINSGMIKEGCNADLILIDMEQAHLNPVYDIPSHLVYSARAADVKTSIVAGKVLMEDRRLCTLSEADVKEQLRKLSKGCYL